MAKRKDISRRIERKIITKGIKVCHCFRIRKLLPVAGSYAVRAQGGSALGQSNIKGYRRRPMVCLDDRQKNQKSTRLKIPYGDKGRKGNIVNTFAFSEGRGIGVVGP